MGNSPFAPAGAAVKRLKLFLWGDSGVGKTTLALHFPMCVVLDMERGTDHYGDSFCLIGAWQSRLTMSTSRSGGSRQTPTNTRQS